VGSVFFVANQTETKKLNGRNVEAALFNIGAVSGGFGMPKSEFVQSTEPHGHQKTDRHSASTLNFPFGSGFSLS